MTLIKHRPGDRYGRHIVGTPNLRKLVIGPAPLVALLVAGAAAHAQQHSFGDFSGPAGTLPNGAPPTDGDQRPWLPSGFYVGNLPNGAPVFAPAAVPATAHVSKKRHVRRGRGE